MRYGACLVCIAYRSLIGELVAITACLARRTAPPDVVRGWVAAARAAPSIRMSLLPGRIEDGHARQCQRLGEHADDEKVVFDMVHAVVATVAWRAPAVWWRPQRGEDLLATTAADQDVLAHLLP